MTVAEIVAALRAGTLTQQQGEEAIQAEIDAAVSAACDRDGMAMSIVQGLLAAKADTNLANLIDQAYTGADAMCERRKRSGT